MPAASLFVGGRLWLVEDLHCGYMATCPVTRLVIVSETFQGLVYDICDEMGIERVELTSCTGTDKTPVKG